jgi:hypothetical protein
MLPPVANHLHNGSLRASVGEEGQLGSRFCAGEYLELGRLVNFHTRRASSCSLLSLTNEQF